MAPPKIYRERLRPPPWFYAVLLLIVPAGMITFLPIDPGLGVILAIGAYAASVAGAAFLPAVSPLLEVNDGWFRAGSARIEVRYLAEPQQLDAEQAKVAMRSGWDAAAHHVTVPWVRRLVSVHITDPKDPTTAWVVSTRRPHALVDALIAAGAAARHPSA